jgi:hypothetical protein
MITVEYDSNNSGGRWWLEDEDWHALEAAGWRVAWLAEEPGPMSHGPDGRFLGALATRASKDFPSLRGAVEEWERITGQDASDEGCNCCGRPHNFSGKTDDGHYVDFDSFPSSFARVYGDES